MSIVVFGIETVRGYIGWLKTQIKKHMLNIVLFTTDEETSLLKNIRFCQISHLDHNA